MRSSDSSFWRFARKVVGCFGLAILALTPLRPAAAQEPAPPADQQADQQPGQTTGQPAEPEEKPTEKVTEEITVTATLREQKVQDVPFSVAAPSEEELRERGVESIEGIAQSTPGFTVQNLGPGQSQVAVRGVSSGQIVRDQPGVKEQVGVYLDDSGISLSLFTPDIDLFDMSRVELLRGPQGTLFGAGSASGTLRYITNQPRLGERETVAELTANTLTDGESGGSAKVAVNAPLGDKAALRLTAFFNSFGGFVDSVQPNLRVREDVNGGERSGGRLALRFQPNDRLTITPRVLYQKVNMDGWNREDAFNILGNPYTTSRPAVQLDERQQFTQFEEPFTDEFLLTDLNIGYDFGNLTLTSITAYTDRDVLVVRDATALTASITGGSIGLPANIYTLNAPLDDATTAKVWTQELRLAGEGDRLDWVTGLFYGTMDRDYGQSLLVSGFETLSGIPTAGRFGAARDVLYFSDLSYDMDQFALFGEATWAVNNRFDLTGGLRYYDFKEDRVQTFDGIFADPGTSTGSTTANGFAPRLIASFALAEGTKLNAQVSKGFRLGGINDPLNVPLCTPQDLVTFGGRDQWEDEVVWNYEVGTKSTFQGGRGTFNVAAYYMDIKNLQATVTAGSCSSRVIFNVPKARSTGLELEWTAAPSDRLDFAISANYGKSELRSTLTSTDAAGNVQVVSGIKSGNRLPTVPEFQGSATATYQWALRQNWLAYLTGIYQYVGSRFTQIGDQAPGFGLVNLNSFGANTIGGPLTQGTFNFNPELPAYDVANLRLGFLGGRWEFAVFVNNLFDETALLSLDQERGTRARVGFLVNQPRTFGITTRVNVR
ncbi:MAG TPA: TonB-dependent receptor [Thermoanaerobaculia bacterium]|jgi:iron complex outermembrane receptor protein|nr:TonB-dependent receptor [Thermoanaerobaculia bacterium]